MKKNIRFRMRLQNELSKRIENNSGYSLRAFAKYLNIESSSLSQIINGNRTLTDKMCERLAAPLELSPEEISFLMGNTNTPPDGAFKGFSRLDEDNFRAISDWYHFAILELTYLESFIGDPNWISKTLQISINQTYDAIRRLIRLKYLEISNEGLWIDKLGDVNNEGNEYTTSAYRKLQKQVLEKAIDALNDVPYEDRVQTSMTLSVSKEKLSKAKKKILNFVEELHDFLKEGESQDEVYNISLSLYPISFSQEHSNEN